VKLILHIGMPKTGTSTLQQALSAHGRALHDAGILYPDTPGTKTDHNALSCLLLPSERIQREFRSPGRSLESVRALGDEFWNDVGRQVSRARATTAVLSSEYLFHYRDEDVQALHALLRPLFDHIEVVAYVRHPADYYLSMAQQKVKASYAIRAPREFRAQYAVCIKRYVAEFDGRVSVRAFEREALVGGSIVQDFASHFLPAIPGPPSELDIAEVNTSMSAEAMCIIQSLRRHAWPDQNDVFIPESQHIMWTLNDIRDEIEQSVPRLKPAIDAGITVRHRPELDWLQSEFGVVFHHDTDLSAHRPDEPAWSSTDLVEILEVDRDSIDRTTALLYKELATRAVAEARTARKPGRSARRPADTPRRTG
jgi:hypothetical protein